MVYKVIGLMSGSSLDGLDIAYVHLQETAATSKDSPRRWAFEFLHTACYPYSPEWKRRLSTAANLSAREYQLLHVEYGQYLGEKVNEFIEAHQLHYQVQLIASHGHTSFHMPDRRMTAQLGDGAALAATTKINVVSDLRAMDIALGGQGAPIVPIGEKLLLYGYDFFLNLGGIANISRQATAAAAHAPDPARAQPSVSQPGGDSPSPALSLLPAGFTAFDICPANRVLNQLAATLNKEYDQGGDLAAAGEVDENLLHELNALPYYGQAYPKSLANEFGTEVVYPMIAAENLSPTNALRTYVEHIAIQIAAAVSSLRPDSAAAYRLGTETAVSLPSKAEIGASPRQMLVTGGGAHNHFLIGRLRQLLDPMGVEVVIPAAEGDKELIDYKEALVMALIGVLRWREENNVLASVTGASRDSIGGAVWIGQEA